MTHHRTRTLLPMRRASRMRFLRCLACRELVGQHRTVNVGRPAHNQGLSASGTDAASCTNSGAAGGTWTGNLSPTTTQVRGLPKTWHCVQWKAASRTPHALEGGRAHRCEGASKAHIERFLDHSGIHLRGPGRPQLGSPFRCPSQASAHKRTTRRQRANTNLAL